MDSLDNWQHRLEEVALAPARRAPSRFRWFAAVTLVMIGWGAYAYGVQVREGLVVTGMRDRISWGLYISVFVSFIGISMAGTFISAMLRAVDARWRSPVIRIAEFITVVALVCAALFIVVDMGRPDRLPLLLRFGRWQSPILWDVLALVTYMMASTLYVYLPMIPDLALFRDRLAGEIPGWRVGIYRMLATGWTGLPEQRRMLGRAITLMMLLVIPVAVTMHTVTSWIFGMTLRVGWNTSLFGIFFVAGAIFSGIAMVVVVMSIVRRAYHLEEYITSRHFRYFGYLLAVFSSIMIYFNVSEYLTSGYKFEEGREFQFRQLFLDEFAGLFWFYVLGGLIVPILIVLWRKTRTIAGVVTASVMVNVAMFVERYFIVVTGLRVPLLPYAPADYTPTWVEWSILSGGLGFFALSLALLLRFFPILSVWEMVEEHERSDLATRLESYPGAR